MSGWTRQARFERNLFKTVDSNTVTQPPTEADLSAFLLGKARIYILRCLMSVSGSLGARQ